MEPSLLAGWAPRAWSLDGQRLLVTAGRFGEDDRVEGFRRLGIVELPDLATVKELGDSDVPVFAAVWFPAEADPLGGEASPRGGCEAGICNGMTVLVRLQAKGWLERQ